MSENSIAQRAERGEGTEPEEEAPELFPLGTLEGDSKSLKTLIKPGLPVKTTVSMRKAEVPSSGGLLDPEREGMVLVTYALDGVQVVPTREGETGNRRIVGWKTRQVIRPIYVERVDGEAGTIEAAFAGLLKADPQSAGALLDRLRDRMSDHVGR